MKKIYYGSQTDHKLIGTAKDEKDVFVFITDFLENKNVKVHYYRSWIDSTNTKIIDFGSWHEFFFVK